MRGISIAVLLAVWLAAVPAFAKPAAELSPEEREAGLAERRRIHVEARKLELAGKAAEAVPLLEKALELERRLLPRERWGTTIDRLADHEELRGNFDRARSYREELIGLMAGQYGEEHWTTRTVRQKLADLVLRRDLSPEMRRELYDTAALASQANRLRRAGKPRELLPVAEELLRMRSRLLGENHPSLADTLLKIGYCHHRLGRDEEAVRCMGRAVEILRTVYGDGYPRYGLFLLELGDVHKDRGRYASAETCYRKALENRRRCRDPKHRDTAIALSRLAMLLDAMGRPMEAEPLLREAVAIARNADGEPDRGYGAALMNLATVLHHLGRTSEAEPLYRQALDAFRKTYGEDHPMFATGCHSLALLCIGLGEHAEAESLFRRALAVFAKHDGKESLRYGRTLGCLGAVHEATGRYERAEPLLRRAVGTIGRVVGERHPAYAAALEHLGRLYYRMEIHARAETLLQRALALRRSVLGRDHPRCADTLGSLAALRTALHRYDQARDLTREVLEVYRSAMGPDHPWCGAAHANLGYLHARLDEHAEADAHYREALRIVGKTRGEDHPDFLELRRQLAGILRSRGRYDEARELLREVLRRTGRSLGERHPYYAEGLEVLGGIAWRTGDRELARRLHGEAMKIRLEIQDAILSVLPERRQLQSVVFLRASLNRYLTLSAMSGSPAADAYEAVFGWKGAIYSEQRLRAGVPGDEARPLVEALRSTSRRLAALQLAGPGSAPPESWRREIAVLTEKRESLEQQLSDRSAANRTERAKATPSLEDLRKALPEGSALVDVVEYFHLEVVKTERAHRFEGSPRLAAFVVLARGEIRRVDLGPPGPIATAIRAWRAGLERGASATAGRDVRRLVWEPITKSLGGARTVLWSPDGALNRLPLAALPGAKPGTFLLDEITVAIVPVPRLLPRLLARKPADAERATLLLVGDVDFGARPGAGGAAGRVAAGTAQGTLPTFGKLEATRAEILAIRDSFETRHEDGEVRMLRRAKATEEEFRAEAGKHRWLHVATHGFFAPPGLKSALGEAAERSCLLGKDDLPLVGYHPGVLCGLALSGANTPPEEDGDDGILTALEVASLDLSGVELAVLSACETGLGEVAGGEGVLGLQRAFQVAGARTTITSLWKVPDVATQLLMARFYENLWDRDMGKLEALREAQLWLMREGGKRGISLPESEGEMSTRLPPFYWAGFVLSGDWR